MLRPFGRSEMLLQVLKLLAADPENQKKAFPDFVIVTEEIALIFDDIYLLAPTLYKNGEINNSQMRKIREINTLLNNMSEKNNVWSLDALSSHNDWKHLRDLAADLLESLGEPKDMPNLSWLTFIKA